MLNQIPAKYRQLSIAGNPRRLLGEKITDDKRPISIKSGVTGCMNCNVSDCKNGSKYEQFPGTNSDACKNRVFAGDNELYAYIASQYD